MSGSTRAEEASLRYSWISSSFLARPPHYVCSGRGVDAEHRYHSKHSISLPHKTSASQSTFPLRSIKLLRDDEGDRGSTLHRNREIRPRKLEFSLCAEEYGGTKSISTVFT